MSWDSWETKWKRSPSFEFKNITLILQKLFAKNFPSISFLTGKTHIIYLQLGKEKDFSQQVERFRDFPRENQTYYSNNLIPEHRPARLTNNDI